MGTTIDVLRDKPVMLVTFTEPIDIDREIKGLQKKTDEAQRKIGKNLVYRVFNLERASLNKRDFITLLEEDARDRKKTRRYQLRTIIVVHDRDDDFLKTVAQEAGYASVPIFDSLDDAYYQVELDIARLEEDSR